MQEVGHLPGAVADLVISDCQADAGPTIDEVVRAVATRCSEGLADGRVREALAIACSKSRVAPGAAIRCARMLLAAGLSDEADLIFTILAAQMPQSPAGLFGRARVAMRLRRWRQAIGFWKEVIAAFPSQVEPAWAIGRARCLFEMDGPTEGSRDAARRALEWFPDDLDALILVTQIAELRGNHHVAVQAWRKFLARSRDIDSYVSALTFAEHSADYQFAHEIVAGAPPFLSNASEFRYRVRLRLYQLILDEEAGLRLLEAPISDDLSSKALARIGNFLINVRQAARAVTIFETALVRYPGDANLVRSYLTAIWMARGVDAVREEKARLLPGLRPGDAQAVIRAAPTLAALTSDELNMMFDEAIRTPDSIGAALISKFLLVDDPNVVPDFAKRLLSVPNPSFRLVGRLLRARLADSQRVARVAEPRKIRQAFLKEALDLTRQVDKLIEEMVKSGDGNPMVIESIEMLQRVARQARILWLNSRECYFDAVSFAEWFTRRVQARQPTSVIRLGDGEGNFLPYSPRYVAHQHLTSAEYSFSGGEGKNSPGSAPPPFRSACKGPSPAPTPSASRRPAV